MLKSDFASLRSTKQPLSRSENVKKVLSIVIAGMVVSAQGGLVHRYRFDQNVNDATGSTHGTASADVGYTEAPLYTNDIPDEVITGAPVYALEVGMNAGAKKSGFQLDESVIGDQGSISLWINPDSLASGNYILNFPFMFSDTI